MKRNIWLIGLVVLLTCCRKTVDVKNVETLIETNTELHALELSGDTIVAVGGSRYEFGSIFVSYNAGESWIRFDSISEKALYAVDIVSPNRFVAAGFDAKLFESNDAGATWNFTQLSHWENIRAVEATADRLVMCGGKGLNIGFVTYQLDPGIPNSFFLDSFANELRDLLRTSDGTWFCSGYGIVMKSSNNGLAWEATAAEGDFFIGLAYANNVLYAGGMNGTVLESTDNGASWKHLKRGNSPVNVGIIWNAFDANENGLVLAGENGKCFYNANGNDKWQKLDLGTDEDITSVKIFHQAVYAATRQGRVIKFNLP